MPRFFKLIFSKPLDSQGALCYNKGRNKKFIWKGIYDTMKNMVGKQVMFDANYINDKRKSVQSTFASWLKQNLKHADESGFSIDNIIVNFSVSEKYDDLCKKRTFRHTSGPVDIKNVRIDYEQLKMLLD